MLRKDVCTHYNGTVNTTCNAGIRYKSIAGGEEYGGLLGRLPCFSKNNLDGLCSRYRLPSQAEVEEQERAIENFVKRMIVTRQAIKDHIDLNGMVGRNVEGIIPCPICEDGRVSYSCAGAYNGHIHANCSTENCISWME